ncbi:hypothetical protein CF326_g7407 [Tilletia indica]|nr:hypothetical protein CF326_g7407 [Tilletia indica]
MLELAAVVRVQAANGDPYKILDVPFGTMNPGEIKHARKKAALGLHPDKNRHPGASDAMKTLNNAFDTLLKMAESDVRHREEGQQNDREHQWRKWYAEDFFRDEAAQQKRTKRTHKRRDQRKRRRAEQVELERTLLEQERIRRLHCARGELRYQSFEDESLCASI